MFQVGVVSRVIFKSWFKVEENVMFTVHHCCILLASMHRSVFLRLYANLATLRLHQASSFWSLNSPLKPDPMSLLAINLLRGYETFCRYPGMCCSHASRFHFHDLIVFKVKIASLFKRLRAKWFRRRYL